MESLETIRQWVLEAVPGASVTIVPNDSPARQPSLLLGAAQGRAAALFLRDDPRLQFDYCSNVTGVDWLDQTVKEKVRIKKAIDGVEKEVEQMAEKRRPGYLEAVYHLYSVALRHGPLAIRMRTANRSGQTHLPSLTPVWRSAEFQEREAFDLYGIQFDGHPDLRRILMWDGFVDYPMRKDYVEPDDYEYEPTAHDKVLEKARRHYPAPVQSAEKS